MRRFVWVPITAWILLYIGTAYADLSSGLYMFSGAARKDPVNIIFLRQGEQRQVTADLHWVGYDDWGGGGPFAMNFKDHGVFDSQDVSVATGFLTTDHWHVRADQGRDQIAGSGPWSQGGAHWDDAFWGRPCASIGWHHVAHFFDRGKVRVADRFSNAFGDTWFIKYVANTKPSPQCEGSMPRGNGFQVRIRMTNR